MNAVREHIPLLARHVGVWEGRYRHLAVDGSDESSCLFRIGVELPESGPAYRQTSHYWWPDGSTEQLQFEAEYANGRLHWDTGRIRGSMWALDDVSLYLRFAFNADPDAEVCEMIQLSNDGDYRARTWHWFRATKLWRVTLVEERRVSHDPADFGRAANIDADPGKAFAPRA